MVLSHQFIAAVTTDADKSFVDKSDVAGGVSHRHNGMLVDGIPQGSGVARILRIHVSRTQRYKNRSCLLNVLEG